MWGTGNIPSSNSLLLTSIVSKRFVFGRKVTFTVVFGLRIVAKLSTFFAAFGVISIDQFFAAFFIIFSGFSVSILLTFFLI